MDTPPDYVTWLGAVAVALACITYGIVAAFRRSGELTRESESTEQVWNQADYEPVDMHLTAHTRQQVRADEWPPLDDVRWLRILQAIDDLDDPA